MTFDDIVEQAPELLQRRGRVTYRTLKRQFSLDDDALADLKHELITGQWRVVDEAGEVPVWSGGAATAPLPTAARKRCVRPSPTLHPIWRSAFSPRAVP